MSQADENGGAGGESSGVRVVGPIFLLPERSADEVLPRMDRYTELVR